MVSLFWTLEAVFLSIVLVLGPVGSFSTTDPQKNVCKTFGSGVLKTFNGTSFYVRSTCPFTLTRFVHNRVECDITMRRGANGLIEYVEISVNKIQTRVLYNGTVFVEQSMVSLPYDHTYQHVFQYGIYTKLRSAVLPISVIWSSVGVGIDSLWACKSFSSNFLDCLQAETTMYKALCENNIYGYENSQHVGCAFFKEIAHQCKDASSAWGTWRTITKCPEFRCLGDLRFQELGDAFVPTCSNPEPRTSNQEITSTCVCPQGQVLNNRAEGQHCVSVSSCPCEFDGRMYTAGEERITKCQDCVCLNGEWSCFRNSCPSRCVVEGQFVNTFDGKEYALPGKCTYVVSKNTYTFTHNSVQFEREEIREFHQSEHALVFWQSSMYVQVFTTFGMKIQVQTSPDLQLYITLPQSEVGMPEERFADEKCQPLRDPRGIFAQCQNHVPADFYYKARINMSYIQACIQRTCACGSVPQQCLCVALANYAKACANQGITVGDWRRNTNCTVSCENNQMFQYELRACNRTCLSLSGPDPRCALQDAPTEGCGCPEGTHLNEERRCVPSAECPCHYPGGVTPPGLVALDGRQCQCANGQLQCSKDCDGLMEDHRGLCVTVDNCTCEFSGKVIDARQSVQTNCRTCTCHEGQWTCVDEECPGSCQVYGNGHYQTFDSKWYRYDGNCQYTLVKDGCDSGAGSFAVRVESVPCCDEALTCARTIVLDLMGQVTLTLNEMKVTRQLQGEGPLVEAEPLYSTHTVGLYIMISVPTRGLTLIWDKHTRLTVILDHQWRNRVCGLCGNFDSNEVNDLQISGSSVVSTPLTFGNSWNTATPPCSDVTNEVFPCQRLTYCYAWAERRCMILRGDTFKDCHLKVDPEAFYQACVLESCSCEFEGKFLGFCTAVAAYAEACSDHDVCVHWRTPDMCPVYCDYYNDKSYFSWHYDPCGQVKTCGKNYRFAGKLEGCYPRCPEEAPYYDENTERCSTLLNCTCYSNETVIKPGTVIRTPTGDCTCEQGRISCAPEPTSTWTTKKWCECQDRKRNQSWSCGQNWTEDCFHKTCNNGTIEMTPVTCPAPASPPLCPRGQKVKVSDGCCDSWKCDCRCDLYGDPHYTSFQGVTFDFLDNCTYILVEEKSPRHQLTVAVDNYFCMDGLDGSCVRGVVLLYQNNTATLSIVPDDDSVTCTLNGKVVTPPYEEHGFRFETTGYMVSVYFPDIRSHISLTPFYTLVLTLAMEHFLNNTQGQCGVCGGSSCVRRNGKTEDDSCCDKTSYDWLYKDPLKPECSAAQTNVSCNKSIPIPTVGPCTNGHLCELFHHPLFANCSRLVDLKPYENNCRFDSCWYDKLACASLEHAAEQCKKVGICVDWRQLTNNTCEVECPTGMVYKECKGQLDDYCRGGERFPGSVLQNVKPGCFCPSGQFRAEEYKTICVSECPYCKGPLGEPKMLGEVWTSNCHVCRCNNQTMTEVCEPKPPTPPPVCSQNSNLVTKCCGQQTCDDQSCAPRVSSVNVTVDNCSATLQLPVCQGQCGIETRWVGTDSHLLQLEQKNVFCRVKSFEQRPVTLHCVGNSVVSEIMSVETKEQREPCCSKLKLFLVSLSFVYFAKAFGGSYMKSSITQIERRFDLPSSLVGVIDGSFEIGNLLVIAFVSYFGAKLHRPRLIGIGCLVMAVGAFLTALPHFFQGRYVYETTLSHTPEENTTESILPCLTNTSNIVMNVQQTAENKAACEKEAGSYMWVYVLLGNMLRGIGETPVMPLGISYLDDFSREENTAIYIACIQSVGILGPMFGFMFGSLCTKIYVDIGFVDLESISINHKDSRWVGAWWLGFLVTSLLMLLVGIPFWFLPKTLPKQGKSPSRNKLKDKDIQTKSCSETTEEVKEQDSFLPEVNKEDHESKPVNMTDMAKDFGPSLKRLFSNKVYMLVLLTGLVAVNGFMGMITFKPKYMEQIYGVSPSKAIFLIGLMNLPAVATGVITGGLIMKRFKMDVLGAARIAIISSLLSFCLLISQYFLICENAQVAGLTMTYQGAPEVSNQQTSLLSQCNTGCSCSLKHWDPVCTGNGLTYASPCLAGCQTSTGVGKKMPWSPWTPHLEVFHNCTCMRELAEDLFPKPSNMSAILGQCPRMGDCDLMFKLYMAISVLGAFLSSCGATPSYIVLLRSISPDLKSLALGMQTLIVRTLGGIPPPIYFGALIDRTCLKWGTKRCGGQGACRFYDSQAFRKTFLGMLIGIYGLSYLLWGVLYRQLSKRQKKLALQSQAKETALEANTNNANGHAVISIAKNTDDPDRESTI
ncbi:hypothetical protein DPEC_G00111940 [Dallia pectoralis]|uniref:Uncharacterized protein n=1 Tax=Dallia pectoralis TaxID=75939 RepID=A0ACC2GTY9_DALPE|nr:hypothetical protein DPEC_G00111940 [Dallia pectoralis]